MILLLMFINIFIKLFEFNKLFPPSYPFSEEINVSNEYMDSRCPSWCDRILVDSLFKNLVDS